MPARFKAEYSAGCSAPRVPGGIRGDGKNGASRQAIVCIQNTQQSAVLADQGDAAIQGADGIIPIQQGREAGQPGIDDELIQLCTEYLLRWVSRPEKTGATGQQQTVLILGQPQNGRVWQHGGGDFQLGTGLGQAIEPGIPMMKPRLAIQVEGE